ncbi:MAG TPA: metalloregulator ArsR/SmtB family transcription factor [Syntrophobacteraceae bacterium]|nr:metalloregulator ArsR/SmtB family transcription factor [Syntrophobacteraceae bacterium]
MLEFMNITKALADENRVRALMALRCGELCVCHLIELLGLAPSTVSKHLSILKQARLVDGRKDGRWIYYRLAGNGAPMAVQLALNWLESSLENHPQIRADAQRLEKILQSGPKDACSS